MKVKKKQANEQIPGKKSWKQILWFKKIKMMEVKGVFFV